MASLSFWERHRVRGLCQAFEAFPSPETSGLSLSFQRAGDALAMPGGIAEGEA